MAQRRYCAFVSYRHADNVQEGRRWAEWLHRGLERYVVPPDLVGQPNLLGEPIPRSLYPIFRDEDELPANADLATGIRAALEASNHLIVLCSPRSAVSPWVRKEVREFKELGRSDRILAVIVAGEPNADDPGKLRDGVMRDEECFCEELRFGCAGTGGAIDWSARTEPTAADLRPAGTRAEGFVTADAYREYLTLNSSLAPEKIAALAEAYRRRLDQALLKVIAGLLGVALGTLVDRDAAHRAELARKELARAEAEAARLRAQSRRLAIAGLAALVLASLAGFFWWRADRETAAAVKATELADQRGSDLAKTATRATEAEKTAQANAERAGRTADRLRLTLSAADQQIGQLLSEQGKYEEALAYEARALRREENPSNVGAIVDSMSFLSHFRLPQVVLPHDNSLTSAAFSPDGTRVMTVSNDNTARVLDASSGEPLGEPMRHEDRVASATFSPDGTRVMTVSYDKTARVWDATSGKPLGEPMRHEDRVTSADFSPDGTRVVTVSNDKTARVWDATSGKPLGEPMRHEDRVTSATFSPDGTQVVTASYDKTARVWDATSGKPLGEPMRHQRGVDTAAFSPDGTRVVTVTTFEELVPGHEITDVQLWDTSSGKPLGEPMRHEGSVASAAFSPDSTRVVTASSGDTSARVWDATSGKPLGEPMRHESPVDSAAFSPDGTRVVTKSWDGTARVWDASSGKPLEELMWHDSVVTSAAFSPDGTRVVTASGGTARVWDVSSGRPLGEPMRHEGSVASAAFSPDGTRVVTASGGTARVWDASSGRPLGEPMRHEGSVASAAFSPDGTRVVTISIADDRFAEVNPDGMLVFAGSEDATVLVWDASSGKPLGEPMRHESSVTSAALSPDGTRVVTASGGTARVWDASSGKPLGEPMRHANAVESAVFSPDGTRVLTASSDKTARVWDATSGRPLGEPMRHASGVASAALSPDGTRVVTVSNNNTARVWDATSGKPLGEPMRHAGGVASAAFSPDGTRVVTASRDGSARVWDASSGKPLGEPMEDLVTSAAFSPDGTRVVTAGFNTARVWNVSLPAPARPDDDFLSQLIELVAYRRFDATGALEPLGEEWSARREKLRQAIAAPTASPALAKAIGWFLADPLHRTISPFSYETTAEWLRRRVDEFTPESLQAAWEVDSADALCLARRARNFALAADPYWADLYSKLALKLAPSDAEAAWRRAAVLALAGRGAEAAAVAGRAADPAAGDAWAWEAKWEACLFLHRDAGAAAARQTAGALAEKMWWYNRNSFGERVKEAEARAAAAAAATRPATGPGQ